jgi:hypothetical protein
MKLSELEPGMDRFMGLFVGPVGASKTVSALSWMFDKPDKPVYIYDIDGRLRSVRKFYRKEDLERVETHKYGPQNFEKLIRHFEKLQDNCPYGLVIMDGLTSMGDQIINYMLSLRGAGGDKEGKGKRAGVIEMAGPEDFGGEARGLSMMLDIARSLPCHFILTAHYLTVTYEDQVTKKTHVQNMLVTAGKKVAAKVPIYFDEMYYFSLESAMSPDAPPKYVVRTSGGSDFAAKTALPIKPKYNITISKPTDQFLYHKIKVDLDKELSVQSF